MGKKSLSEIESSLSFGRAAMNILRLAANVVDGETITIGGSVYEIDIINTDSTINVTGVALNATDAETTLAFAGHGRKVQDLIRIDNEIMRVIAVLDVDTIRVARARAGTAIATHALAADIFTSNAAPASNIPIGLVTTLTPTVASAAIVNAINDYTTQEIAAVAISVNEILIRTKVGAVPRALACTETLAGANNVFAAATMYGATAQTIPGFAIVGRAANATEVALDHMLFFFPFTPAGLIVQVRTSAGALKTWDGAITASSGLVTVTNGGSSDWAATDVVTVLASE